MELQRPCLTDAIHLSLGLKSSSESGHSLELWHLLLVLIQSFSEPLSEINAEKDLFRLITGGRMKKTKQGR